MQQSYDRKVSEFRDFCAALRPEIADLKKQLLEDHPEAADGTHIDKSIREATQQRTLDLSLRRFEELFDGANLEGGELLEKTAYNSLPDRDPWNEEPTPERQMLDIIAVRLGRLWDIHRQDGPKISNVQEKYSGLHVRYNAALKEFVDWKRGTPEGAMRELLATAKALGRNIPDEVAANIDSQVWHISIDMPLYSNDWPETLMFQELMDTYKRLLDRAARSLN